MNFGNNKKNYLMFGIILLSVVVISLSGTYAHFVASVGGIGNTTNNQTSVTSVDLGSIYYEGVTTFTSTNLYPGMKFVQTFEIGPNSDTGIGVYEIDLDSNLPSVFENDLKIKLYKTTNKTINSVSRTEGTLVQNENRFYKEDTILITGTPELIYEAFTLTNDSKIILEQVEFDVTTFSETTYYLVYEYANNGNQDDQQGLSFSGKITVQLIDEKWTDYELCVDKYGEVQCQIMAQLEEDTTLCPKINMDSTIKVSSAETKNAFVCAAPDDYGTSYYFRGVPENNWVKFGGYYWRILRINGDNSIRIIYAGDASLIDALDTSTKNMVLSNGYNDSSTLYTQIGTSSYNTFWKKDNVVDPNGTQIVNDNAGIGYMYGNLADGETNTTSMEQAQTNTNDSDIKAYLDNWYASNLKRYASYISDTLFCNDRSIPTSKPSGYSNLGYGVEKTVYRWNSSSNGVKLLCEKQIDRFTVDDEAIGNGDLTYPIGLLTTDESYLAGGSSSNNAYYLYTGNHYWAMSPYDFSGTNAYVRFVYSNGYALSSNNVSTSYGVRPVINLKPNVLNSGDGTTSNPYKI